jgi:hypothetical protein
MGIAKDAASSARRKAKTPADARKATGIENPRTARSREKFEEASALIAKEMESGVWISSIDIQRKFNGKIAEGMYGRVKSALGIEHRRVKGDSGPATYEWRLPKS